MLLIPQPACSCMEVQKWGRTSESLRCCGQILLFYNYSILLIYVWHFWHFSLFSSLQYPKQALDKLCPCSSMSDCALPETKRHQENYYALANTPSQFPTLSLNPHSKLRLMGCASPGVCSSCLPVNNSLLPMLRVERYSCGFKQGRYPSNLGRV